MKVHIKDIHLNPFRDLKFYPISEEKVVTLMTSIKDTTFWDNLVVRKAPDGDGYEAAFGVHRLEALKRLAKKDPKFATIEVILRKLDDSEMLRIMANENMTEWAHNAQVEQETVRATVLAHGSGRVTLPPLPPKTPEDRIRYAPSFGHNSDQNNDRSGSNDHPYTTETVAKFLKWPVYKIDGALAALALMEEGLAPDFAGLSSKQAAVIASQTKRVLKATGSKSKAKAIGKKLVDGMLKADGKKGGKGKQTITTDTAKYATDAFLAEGRAAPKGKAPPDIDQFVSDIAHTFERMLSDKLRKKLETLVAYADHVSKLELDGLLEEMRSHAQGVEKYARQLETSASMQKQKPQPKLPKPSHALKRVAA